MRPCYLLYASRLPCLSLDMITVMQPLVGRRTGIIEKRPEVSLAGPGNPSSRDSSYYCILMILPLWGTFPIRRKISYSYLVIILF